MKIHVKYFAALREALGTGEVVTVPEGSSAAALRDTLLARGGAHADVLARGRSVRVAVNQAMCEESTVLAEGAEVAFFPPVTGG